VAPFRNLGSATEYNKPCSEGEQAAYDAHVCNRRHFHTHSVYIGIDTCYNAAYTNQTRDVPVV